MFDPERVVCFHSPGEANLSLNVRDIIDVWINTRYMHTGKSGRVGRFTRQDFRRFEKQAGAPQFAFTFVHTIW